MLDFASAPVYKLQGGLFFGWSVGQAQVPSWCREAFLAKLSDVNGRHLGHGLPKNWTAFDKLGHVSCHAEYLGLGAPSGEDTVLDYDLMPSHECTTHQTLTLSITATNPYLISCLGLNSQLNMTDVHIAS